MNKLSIHKISLAAFSGVAVLMVVASMSVQANASYGSNGGSKFRATPEELRRHCWRIDETFWMSKRRYGCGDIFCAAGKCRTTFKLPPPPTYPPPQLSHNGGEGKGGARGAGGAGGGEQSGSAGGPN